MWSGLGVRDWSDSFDSPGGFSCAANVTKTDKANLVSEVEQEEGMLDYLKKTWRTVHFEWELQYLMEFFAEVYFVFSHNADSEINLSVRSTQPFFHTLLFFFP